MSKKNILVTGGAGFLGKHLCHALLNGGHRVLCIDNFQSSNKESLTTVLDNPNFELVEGDITEKIKIKTPIDEIYNLACVASPPLYQKTPIQTLKTSVVGTLNILELAQEKTAKLLQASSSEVYGDPKIHPQPETYWGNVNPIGIRACYDEGKRAAESLTFDFARNCELSIKVVRIFNTYGPGMRSQDGRVISTFITQALKGDPLTLFGDGSQTRSFCYVDDLIGGVIKMMETGANIQGPVNLGSQEERTIRQVAADILALTGSKSRIKFNPLPQDDPKIRRPDLTRAKHLLSWEPEISFEKGLKATINYFKETL